MNAPLLSLVEITRFEKTGGPLTKRVYLKPDGAIANDSSDCRMSRGVMHRQHPVDWRALAGLIEETPRKHGLCARRDAAGPAGLCSTCHEA